MPCTYVFVMQLQERWEEYVEHTRQCYSPEFWELHHVVKAESVALRNALFTKVRELTQSKRSQWPTSVRGMRERVNKRAGCFFDFVQETHKIDLTQFQIPGIKAIQFTFVDPIWVWIKQCNECVESGLQMHWTPKTLTHPCTGEPLYGAGIQYGKLMHAACQQIPRGGKPALGNLSWDAGDTVYSTRSACPILLQVMNTNSSSVKSAGLVGYVPTIEVADALNKKPSVSLKQARAHVLQARTNMRQTYAHALDKHM